MNEIKIYTLPASHGAQHGDVVTIRPNGPDLDAEVGRVLQCGRERCVVSVNGRALSFVDEGAAVGAVWAAQA